jgi:hypothetical protein
MDNLPTRLRRMNAQLEVFKDPSKGARDSAGRMRRRCAG